VSVQGETNVEHGQVSIVVDSATLSGNLIVPAGASGLVLFAHGSGSSRLSPRNRAVADIIRAVGNGTLLFDLLTEEEEATDAVTAELRFDIEFLAKRLLAVTEWLREREGMRIGYFGASTGAAAALVAAALAQDTISAVVSRGGRPDLAGNALSLVRAPTLLLVGGFDTPVIRMNQAAYEQLECEKQLTIIPGASHLFEEPGTLDQVARLGADWFQHHLGAPLGDPRMGARSQHHLPR
jgi:putative phosphoribosyl transferase